MDVTQAAPAAAELSAREFRRACGQFATGVTIITVRDGGGYRGMTANAFTSVSLDPPLILVSIDRRNRTHRLLETGERFAVNVLAEEHRHWSDRFAGRHGDLQDRFDDVPHTLVADGLPLIAGALASFICRVVDVHPAGDHSLFIGRVERIESRPEAEPLLFFGGTYRSLGPTPRPPAEIGRASAASLSVQMR